MLRRPLLHGTILFIASQIMVQVYGIYYAWAIAFMLFLLCCFSKVSERKQTCLICLLFYLCGMGNVMVHDCTADPLTDLAGESVHMEGRVLSCSIRDKDTDDQHMILIVETGKSSSRIRVTSYSPDAMEILPEDQITIYGQVTLPDGRRNPNCFNYQLYLKSISINTVMTTNSIQVLEHGYGLRKSLYLMKEEYLQGLGQATDIETEAFVRGILFGDKSGIADDVIEEFQRNGTAHILAVSGLHVGLLYGFLSKLWKWRKRYAYFMFISICLGCYCILSDMSPSVLRASIMIILHTFAQLTNRRYDLSSAAFAVALVLLLHNPYQLYNTGFQMSFLAVLTMSLVLPYIKKIREGALNASIAVQLGLLPYTMYTFNYLSVASFLVNVPIIMLVGILVPVGLISFVLSTAVPGMFHMDYLFIKYLCVIIDRINSWTCFNGLTTFQVISPPRTLMAIYYLMLLVFMSEQGRLMLHRDNVKKVFFILIMVLILAFSFGHVTRSGFENVPLTFVDVGQGDCMHLETEEGYHYLIDGGGSESYSVGKQTLRPYLLKNGVSHLDGVIVSHLHTDHYQGIVELCHEGMVDDLYMYEGNRAIEDKIVKETGLNPEHIHYLYGGMNLKLGEHAAMDILWPEQQSSDYYDSVVGDSEHENEISLIMKLQINGVSVLITGDIDEECELDLVKSAGNRLQSDILKVAHHGSKYSSCTEFLQTVDPSYAMIQVGRNTYGHPTPEAIARLQETGATVMRNDEHGAIGVNISEHGISLVTVKGENDR